MGIGSIKSLGSVDPRAVYGSAGTTPAPRTSFAEQLKNAVAAVNDLQIQREDMVEQMATGEVTEVQDVMIAAKESQLAFELLLEIRNKLLESYQEIMHMQV
ncbi:MAG: flagellar hook-basal body complex protein FliE [Candidatus Krumholzibacteriota bacterium]